MASCPLCSGDEETVLWRDALCRITLVADPDYAGFCRVIWGAHAQEMSDLVPAARAADVRGIFARAGVA